MKKTKIIGTIGPSSDNKEVLTKMVQNGLNVVRLNMSHGTYEEQLEKVNLIREINSEIGTNVAILLDTKGPEVRTGLFENGKITLTKGDTTVITMDDVEGTPEKFTVTYKGLNKDVNQGQIILLDDGYVAVEVLKVNGKEIECLVLNTGDLKDRRGVNVPGVTLNFEFMSEKDEADIKWACENNLDFIAASFVRNQKDLKLILSIVESVGDKHIQIIPKIESQDGVENFDEILELSDGIMIARGDLGVEVPAEEVPIAQKMMIRKCNNAGKFVITATQMLESMQDKPRPTRAEVSDVFNAVVDGSDAVMLSGETAAGEYPVESVQTQATIAKKAEGAIDYGEEIRRKWRSLEPTSEEMVALSVATTAAKIEEVKLIIAITNSGSTAKKISQKKPNKPIVAITHDPKVLRSLALTFGVYPVLMEQQDTLDALLETALLRAKEAGHVKAGDKVVISAGSLFEVGTTDLMKVEVVK